MIKYAPVKINLWLMGFVFALLAAPLLQAQPAPVVQAQLVMPANVAPGRTVVAQVKLIHAEGWHTYGPAEVGATTLQWTLPQGWSVGEIQWPNQKNFLLQGISSWGYSGPITLRVPLRVSSLARPGSHEQVSVRVDWIACGDGQCVPGGADLQAVAPLGASEGALGPVKNERMTSSSSLDYKILFGAFLGGLVLNLMPCVFPVLGIKILSFVKHSGAHRRVIVHQSLAYGLGIILSAVALGALIVGVRSGGQAVGWGFQLQDPRVMWSIVVILALFAMHMAGGWSLPSLGGAAAAKADQTGGLWGALGSGAVMVAVATPCSAPFLAVAIGSIFTLPAWQAVGVMALMGLGMALPYWLLALYPAIVKKLPKPGAWMEDFKLVLAWVMAAAVLYQMWVYVGQVTPEEGLKGLMGALAALAGVWAVAHWRRVGRVVGVLFVILGAWAGLGTHAQELAWEAWSPERVAQLRQQGRIVVVDFTARWCVNCQINERVVWGNAEIKKLVREKNIALLKADWTKRDSAIASELKGRGLSAVPLLVVYSATGPAQGREAGLELPNLLTPAQVAEALR